MKHFNRRELKSKSGANNSRCSIKAQSESQVKKPRGGGGRGGDLRIAAQFF